MYNIKHADKDDAKMILQIIKKTWLAANISYDEKKNVFKTLDELYSTEKITLEIEHQIEFYLLIIEKELSMAFVSYAVSNNSPVNFKLKKIYSLPESQGKGYIKILIDKVNELAKDRQANYLYIHLNGNRNKIGYFEALGFQVYTEFSDTQNSITNDLIMRKSCR